MYLTQSLHRALQLRPDALAVCHGERQTTFRQFSERAARLAGALRGLGLQAGDRVGMLALNSDRYMEYQMAVPWAGGVLNPCNIRWSAAEIAYSLDDCTTAILLIDDAFLPMAEAVRAATKTPLQMIYAGENAVPPPGMLSYEALLTQSEPIADAMRGGDDLAVVMYTGGTTGFPKGVMISHCNLYSSTAALLAEGFVRPGDTYLHVAPMFHGADYCMGLVHWAAGNTHVVIPKFDADALMTAAARHRATHTLLVPTMIQMLLDSPAMQAQRNAGTLRSIFYGASPIAEPLLDRAMEMWPDMEFIQGYGMTELAPLATINSAYNHSVEGRKLGKLRSAGRAGYCVEVRIVDEHSREVPRGTVGEVAVRGPNVMQGYWGKPEQTAAAVRDGWMHTGDGAYMDDDGYIFICDRIKDMIVSGGENVYSAEVENVVARHPAVAACAVIGVPDKEWGERVHAVIVPKPGASVTQDELYAFCKHHIAGYKCPRSLELREALPLSGAGKVLKTELRKPHWDGQSRNVA